MTASSADIVIVGAGIIGANIAYQIARRSRLKVIVLDKGKGPGEGSTGASSAVCRFKYSHPETVALALNGISAYQNWSDYTGIAEPRASYHRHGMLWLACGAKVEAEAEAARLRSLGVGIDVLDDVDLAARYPALSPCTLAPDLISAEPHKCVGGGTHLLETEAGYVDPVDALQDVLDAGRRLGVDIRFNSHVHGIDTNGGRVTAVRLGDGSSIRCGTLVNAAGAWCNELAAMAGLDLAWPLVPTRIQVAHIERPAEIVGDIPVTCDLPGGIYFRTQNRGQQIIVGSILEEDEREAVRDPDDFAHYADDDFTQAKLYALEHRIPGLRLQGVRGYSGLYTVNRLDVHPVVGKTDVAGLYLANGCSGHGFKLAPAIGAMLASQVTGVSLRSDPPVDPGFLAYGRAPINLRSKSVLA